MSCRLAIVIISYNTRDYLCRCIESIFEHAPPVSFEVVVVDNASRDGSAQAVRERFPNVKLLAGTENRGYSIACNLGFNASDSEFVLLLNSDTEMRPGTLAGLVAAIEAQPRTGVLGPVLVDGHGDIIQMSWGWEPLFFGEIIQGWFAPKALVRHPKRVALVRRLQLHDRTVPLIYGAAMLFRRAALNAVGGMDEEFVFYLEDTDICTRLRKAGWDVKFLSGTCLVHHLGKSTEPRQDRIALIYRQSQLRYYQKHGSALDHVLLAIYLRLRFWRIYLPPQDAAAAAFYRQLRDVFARRTHVGFE